MFITAARAERDLALLSVSLNAAAAGHVAVSPLTWPNTGQSTGEAIPITLSTSRTWNGQSSTVSALTMVDWER